MERIGDYTVVRELGRGAGGRVLEVRDGAGRALALKQLHRDHPRARERLMREVRALLRLRHPHVLPVYGVELVDGRPALLLELAPGGTLEERLARQGPRPPDEVLALGRALAGALGQAHREGLLHRDVKPGNVLFGARGEPLLADFGLSLDPEDARLTLSGAFLGTPGYAAPELCRGERERIGPPADVYGLGATLYAALSGRPPRSAGTLAGALDELERPMTPLTAVCPGVPHALARVVTRCLESDPARRFPDGSALEAALLACAAAPRSDRSARRLAAGALLAGALGAAGILLHAGRAPTPLGPSSSAAPAPAPASPSPDDSQVVAAPSPAAGADPRYLEARRLLDGGRDLPRARLLLDAVLAERPQDPGASLARGDLRQRVGDTTGALEDFDRAVAGLPDPFPALIMRGCLRGEGGDTDGAIEDLSRATELHPERSQGWHYRGYFQLQRGEPAAAEADLRRALELLPGDPSSWVNLGSARGQQGDLDEALRCYDRALALDPDRETALLYQGNTLLAQGRPAEARESFARLIRLRPDDAVHAERFCAVCFELDDFAAAIPVAEGALRSSPRAGALWYQLGIARAGLGQHQEALAAFAQALAGDGADPATVSYAEGNSWRDLGEGAQARAAYSRAIELRPQDASAWINRAGVSLAAGDAAAARADLDQALVLDPAIFQAWSMRAASRLALGDAAGALEDATRCLALQPRWPTALETRARARRALGDLEGARADLTALLHTLPPEDPGQAKLQAELATWGQQ